MLLFMNKEKREERKAKKAAEHSETIKKAIEDNIKYHEDSRAEFNEYEASLTELTDESEYYISDKWLISKHMDPKNVNVHYDYDDNKFYILDKNESSVIIIKTLSPDATITHEYIDILTNLTIRKDTYKDDGDSVICKYDQWGCITSQVLSDKNNIQVSTFEYENGILKDVKISNTVLSNNTSSDKKAKETKTDKSKQAYDAGNDNDNTVKLKKEQQEFDKRVKQMKSCFNNRLEFSRKVDDLKKQVEAEGIDIDSTSDNPDLNRIIEIIKRLDNIASGKTAKKFNSTKQNTAAKLCVELLDIVNKVSKEKSA